MVDPPPPPAETVALIVVCPDDVVKVPEPDVYKVTDGALTVILNALSAVPPSASVALTVNENVPEAFDVPEIKPPPITDRIEIKAVDKEKISELMIAA